MQRASLAQRNELELTSVDTVVTEIVTTNVPVVAFTALTETFSMPDGTPIRWVSMDVTRLTSVELKPLVEFHTVKEACQWPYIGMTAASSTQWKHQSAIIVTNLSIDVPT
jgi:hypothetical protein